MKYPFSNTFINYLKTEDKSPATITSFNQTIDSFFAYLTENNPGFVTNPVVENIFDRDIESFLQSFGTSNLSNSTYNKLLSQLNTYFKFLFSRNLNPNLPTVDLHGKQKSAQQSWSFTWLEKLTDILIDERVSPYTKMTLFLLSRGFTTQEFLQPGFQAVLATIRPRSTVEQNFLTDFAEFIQPLQEQQQTTDIFLKQRLNPANPNLTLPALHKYLKKDAEYLGFNIIPKHLHQSYILNFLNRHTMLSNQQLQAELRLDPASLQYYQQLQRQLS